MDQTAVEVSWNNRYYHNSLTEKILSINITIFTLLFANATLNLIIKFFFQFGKQLYSCTWK